MLSGYRTYIALAVLVLNNLLQMMGFTDYTSQQVTDAINVVAAVAAFIFRYLATKKKATT